MGKSQQGGKTRKERQGRQAVCEDAKGGTWESRNDAQSHFQENRGKKRSSRDCGKKTSRRSTSRIPVLIGGNPHVSGKKNVNNN